jgi:microsomal epoxide hydrolase
MLKQLIFLVILGGGLYFLFGPSPPRPAVKADGWWGKGVKKADEGTSIRPFKVNIPDAVLKDLDTRLANTRLGEDLEESTFEYGFQVAYMKEIIQHWRTKFDWRKQESIMNSFPQFLTKIEGIDVHFIHVKPKTPGQ